MGTNYIAPIWRMPRNANNTPVDKLSNYSLEFGPTTADVISTNTTWQTDVGLDNVTKVSFSVWVNPNSGTGSSIMAVTSQAYGTWNGNFNITYRADITTLALEFRGAGGIFTNSSTTLAGDTWHHICFVLDLTLGGTIAQEVRCFVNNSEVANQSSASPPLNFVLQTTSFNIGRTLWGSGGSGYQWQGKIAQACFFDYTLSESQVEYLYNLNNPMVPGTVNLTAPVAYWPLGDNSNPNANAGYPNISTGTDSVFDFTPNQYINIGDSNLLSFGDSVDDFPFSISGWFYFDATGSYGLVAKYGTTSTSREWMLYTTGSNFRLLLYDTNGNNAYADASDTTIVANKWYHVVATYNGAGGVPDAREGIQIYVNGQPETMVPTGGANYVAMHNTGRRVDLGSRSNTSYFDGQMSNVQIWGVELSAANALELYNNGQPLMTGTQPQQSNLLAWWKLNQTANWEADTVGNWQIPDTKSTYPRSFKFNEIQDYIQGDLNLDGEKVHAVSFWIKNKQASGISYVLSTRSGSYGPGFNFILRNSDSNGNIYSNVRDTPTTTQSNISGYQSALRIPKDDNWHHVIFTHDIVTNKLKAYINGVFKYEMLPTSRTDSNTINPLKISHNISTQDFGGYVSNVMVWEDVVLTDGGVALNDVAGGEIAQVYNNGVPITSASVQPDKLKGWYKLDDNELFDGTNWSVENQKYPANYESALYFTGGAGNEHLETPSNSDLLMSGSHTFSAWIYVNSTQVDVTNYIFDKSALDYSLGFAGNQLRLIYYNYYDSGGPSGTNTIITLDTDWKTKYEDGWHHIVVSVDQPSLTVTLITDGTEISTHSLPADYVSPDQGGGILNIMSYNGTTLSLAGFISNLAFYNGTALTTAQALTLYNNGTPEDNISFSPTSWWKIDNTSTGLLDNAGTANLTNTGGVELSTFVSSTAGVSRDMTRQNLVNNNVSVLNGQSVSMSTTNLVQSNLTRTQSYSNYSFNFDAAVLDYFDLGGLQGTALQPSNTTLVSDGFSVSVWVNLDDTSSPRTFWQNDGLGSGTYYGLIFLMNTGGQLNMGYNNGGGSGSGNRLNYITTSAQITSTNTWYHIVAIFKGVGSVASPVAQGLYVNGVEITAFNSPTGSASALVYSSSAKGSIGVGRNGIQSMEGKISNCACFDRTLTQDEVLNIYNNGVPQDLQTASSFSNNLVAWWPMDGSNSYYEGNNWTIRDLEGAKDGTGINTGNVDDLVGNAPGSDANGSGNNLAIEDLIGNMSNSDKNAYSINMGDYADGVTNPADSGRSTEIPTVP